jgi:hypothetical protein
MAIDPTSRVHIVYHCSKREEPVEKTDKTPIIPPDVVEAGKKGRNFKTSLDTLLKAAVTNAPEGATKVEAVIGSYADYLDTGIWDMKGDGIVAPDDLTIAQLKDFLAISGGAVYLRQDRKLGWDQGNLFK